MLGNHRFFVSKATVFLCTTVHIFLKAKRRRTINEDASSLGTMCAHKEANLGPKGTQELTCSQGIRKNVKHKDQECLPLLC